MIDIAYSLKVVTGPTVWVADVGDVKAWGRYPDNDNLEESVISDLIKKSTAVMEVMCNRIFCTQTLEIRLDEFPWDGVIQLPTGPWQSTGLTVNYYDAATEILTLIAAADYVFEETSGILTTITDGSWPDSQRRPGAIRIQYKAGYGDMKTDPPIICKQAVIAGCLDELENRAGRFQIPPGVKESLMTLWPGTI